MFVHKESCSRSHACEHCNQRFVTSKYLKKHLLTHSGEEEIPFDENVTVSNTEETNPQFILDEEGIDHEMQNNSMEFKCVSIIVEGEFFSSKFIDNCSSIIVRISQENFEGGDSMANESVIDEQEPCTSQNKIDKKSFACDECDRMFTRPSHLRNHKNVVHRAIRPYACEQCIKRFGTLWSLKRHLKTHTGEKPYHCDGCSKSFRSIADLKSHKKNVHLGIRPFKCRQCNKCFAKQYILNVHLLTHSDEKPFPCDECNRSFTSNYKLISHKKGVHLGIRPFKCQHCNKSFASQSNLNEHLKAHTGNGDNILFHLLQNVYKLHLIFSTFI